MEVDRLSTREGGHRRPEPESRLGQDSRFHQAPLLKNADQRGERDFA